MRYFYLLDISSAYRNTSLSGMVSALRTVDLKVREAEQVQPADTIERLQRFLVRYCFHEEDGLLIGAPASPDLFNIFCEVHLDRPLRIFCEKHCITYSRFIDDLTFSCREPIGKRKRRKIRGFLEDAGFSVNHLKSDVIDIIKRPVVVCGIGLRANGRTFLPRNATRKIRGLLHLAAQGKIAAETVQGYRGLFLAATSTAAPNRTETRILRAFDLLKRAQKERT